MITGKWALITIGVGGVIVAVVFVLYPLRWAKGDGARCAFSSELEGIVARIPIHIQTGGGGRFLQITAIADTSCAMVDLLLPKKVIEYLGIKQAGSNKASTGASKVELAIFESVEVTFQLNNTQGTLEIRTLQVQPNEAGNLPEAIVCMPLMSKAGIEIITHNRYCFFAWDYPPLAKSLVSTTD